MVELLCGLAFVLLLVMVVGHGMWVAAAWLFRGGSQSSEIGKPCPHCGAQYGVRQGRCVACGAVPNLAPGSVALRDDLKTTLRQVSRLLDRGEISQQQYDAVRVAVQAELERVSGVAEQRQHAALPGPGLVPANGSSEVVDAVLVESTPRGADAPRSPVHPLDRPILPEAPRETPKPGRPLADVLQSFMEESNIRWGEILAALVIVLCSVGLVISLRSTLEAIPYFPAILFTGFTLAFHGAGLYTLRRWKLHAVSRVILIISLLLVPLTFSAAIVMSNGGQSQRPASDPLLVLMVAAGIGIFTWVCYSASRELIARGAWPLTVGIVGCAASQVLIERVDLNEIGFWRLSAIGAVPLAGFLVSTIWQWADAQRWRQLSQRRVLQILLVTGTASFALLAPLALLLVRSEDRGMTVSRLSPELSLAAAAILALGLLIHRRTTALQLAAWQTAGTAIVVLGAALMAGLVASAWPDPELLLAVALINCLVLAGLGWFSTFPLLYVPATVCAALAVTIGLHWMGRHFTDGQQLTRYQRSLQLIQAGLMGRTGVALTVLSGLIAGVGAWFAARRKADEARMLLASAGGLAAAAILIAVFSGFVSVPSWPQDRDLAAAMLLLYGAAMIGVGPVVRWPTVEREANVWRALVGLGSLLLWAAFIQALLINSTIRGGLEAIHRLPHRPILVATIAQGVLTALLAAAATGRALYANSQPFEAWRATRRMHLLAEPLAISAAVGLVLAAPFVIAVPNDQFGAHAALAAWATAGWLLITASQRWRMAVNGVQAMAAVVPALVIAGSWKAAHGSSEWMVAHEHLFSQMIAVAIGATIWSTLRWVTRRWEVMRDLLGAGLASVDQVLLAAAATAAAAYIAQSAWIIAAQPVAGSSNVLPVGSWLSYVAIGSVVIAVLCQTLATAGKAARSGLANGLVVIMAGSVVVVAAALNPFDVGGRWIAFHILVAGWLAVSAAAAAAIAWQAWRRRLSASAFAPHHLVSAILAWLVIALSIRGSIADPQQPWWSLAAALGACVVMSVLGLARRSQTYAFVSTGLSGLAVALFWVAPATAPWIALLSSDSDLVRFAGLEFMVTAAIATAGFWLWQEVISQRRFGRSLDTRPWMPRVHALLAIGLVPLHLLLRVVIALAYPGPSLLSGFDVSLMMTSLALGGLLLGSLWDRRAVWTLPLTYLWLAAVWCLAIGECGGWLPRPGPRVTALVLAVAGQVALSGQIWSYGANLAAWGVRLGVTDPVGGLARTARWLPIVNLMLGVVVCVASLVLILTLPELQWRVAAAWGPAAIAWGLLCLAQGQRRDALQLASLLLAGLSAIYLAWAQMDASHDSSIWMTRVFRLLMVLAALTFIYGLMLPRFLLTSGAWNAATRRAGYIAGAAAMATFVATLAMEVALFEPGRGAPVDDIQVAAVAVVLLGLIAGLISMAILPGRDPLVLSDTGRQGYVYAAQVTAALLFAHIYVCKPLWFGGVLRDYWPFIVMALAFAGVGAAELFRRFRVRVLAEPLERTGSLLPILPVLGWWVPGSQVDYSLLLFIVGILYLALSYARKSWAAMVAAVVAGNGALWSFLFDQEFFFAKNPQVWLIPPALSVLVAAHLNRHRLTAETLAGIRYAATIVIYLSSTSQIFITGIGQQLWPPMVLLAFAVAGALAGIALRVRAFLFLGMTFTLLALASMVAHASRSINHVWPWWVFGIFLGVAILVLFGVFEKKRSEVMQLVGRLRQWEG